MSTGTVRTGPIRHPRLAHLLWPLRAALFGLRPRGHGAAANQDIATHAAMTVAQEQVDARRRRTHVEVVVQPDGTATWQVWSR